MNRREWWLHELNGNAVSFLEPSGNNLSLFYLTGYSVVKI